MWNCHHINLSTLIQTALRGTRVIHWKNMQKHWKIRVLQLKKKKNPQRTYRVSSFIKAEESQFNSSILPVSINTDNFTVMNLLITCLAIFSQYLSSNSISSFFNAPLTAVSFSCSKSCWIFRFCSSIMPAISFLEITSRVTPWSVWLPHSEVLFFRAFIVWSSLLCHSFSSCWMSFCLICFQKKNHMKKKKFKEVKTGINS